MHQGADGRDRAQAAIKFSEDSFDVRLLVALAAEDSNSHIEAMQVLAGIFMDEEKIAQIVALDDTAQIYQAFMDGATA